MGTEGKEGGSSPNSADRLTAMEENLEKIQRLLDANEGLRRRNGKLRMVGVLAIILVVLLNMTFLGLAVADFVETDIDRFMAILGREVSRAVPDVVDTLGEIAKEVGPTYESVFQAKLKEAGPAIAKKVDQETTILVENMSKQTQELLRGTLKRSVEKQKQILLEEIPELKDEKMVERLLRNLVDSSQIELYEVFDERLSASLKALTELDSTIRDIKPDPSLQEEENLRGLLLGTFLELAHMKLQPREEPAE